LTGPAICTDFGTYRGAFDDLHALQSADEIDPPVLTPELPVSNDREPEPFLIGYDIGDRSILDRM
jgi:hypothetical protein